VSGRGSSCEEKRRFRVDLGASLLWFHEAFFGIEVTHDEAQRAVGQSAHDKWNVA
jgi:hypothetical protein